MGMHLSDLTKKNTARMEWEKPYLEALIDHLKPSGRVLEVGFALGHSSAHIQTFQPHEHIIIEADPAIALSAKAWASSRANISVIQDTWEHALPKLGVFDAIFFNDFRPETAIAKDQNREIGSVAIQKGKELLENIKEEIPHLMSMRYSDSDIDELCKSVDPSQHAQLSKFLHQLVQNEQISKAQYDRAASMHNMTKSEVTVKSSAKKQSDPLLYFLQLCLSNHMLKGSRFSCFAHDRTSNFGNSAFFESIITNPDVDYQEKLMPVEVPPSCEYYKFNHALIMVIEKQR